MIEELRPVEIGFAFHRVKIQERGYLERTSVLDFVGAASGRDRFNSRPEAAPTGVLYSYLS